MEWCICFNSYCEGASSNETSECWTCYAKWS